MPSGQAVQQATVQQAVQQPLRPYPPLYPPPRANNPYNTSRYRQQEGQPTSVQPASREVALVRPAMGLPAVHGSSLMPAQPPLYVDGALPDRSSQTEGLVRMLQETLAVVSLGEATPWRTESL